MSEEQDNIPAGWIKTPLKEIIPSSGVFCDGDWVESKDQDPNGDVRLIQLADIGDGKFINKSDRYLTKNKARELNCTFLETDDLLIARMPDPLGRACVFPLEGYEKYVTVVDVCMIRVAEEFFAKKFLMYLINSPTIRKLIDIYKSGSTRKRISRGNLAKVFLPIPPLAEQHRIVDKIEELFSDLDDGIASLKKAQQQLKVYRQAVLKWAFEGKLTAQWREEQKRQGKLESAETLLAQIKAEREQRYHQELAQWQANVETWEAHGKVGKKPGKPNKLKEVEPLTVEDISELSELPKEWKWIRLGHVFRVCVGSTPSRKEGTYWGGDVHWVSSGEVAFCKIFSTRETITQLGLQNCSTEVHPPGTVMLGMIGEGKTRGQSAILMTSAAHNQNTAAIRVSETGCSSELLYYYFYYQYQKTREIGSGNNQKALNKDRVEHLTYPLCYVKGQLEIIQEIESRLSICDSFDATIAENLDRAEALRQSILKQAFEGKLVPQDPNDEPASVLLERIRASKAAQAEDNKQTKRKQSL